MSSVEPSPSHITEHAFEAPGHQPWGLCVHCGMSEAAHERTDTPYAWHLQPHIYHCPECGSHHPGRDCRGNPE